MLSAHVLWKVTTVCACAAEGAWHHGSSLLPWNPHSCGSCQYLQGNPDSFFSKEIHFFQHDCVWLKDTRNRCLPDPSTFAFVSLPPLVRFEDVCPAQGDGDNS
ncbi:hypothetical protein ACRRTK_012902 [Alexandromys fortis]